MSTTLLAAALVGLLAIVAWWMIDVIGTLGGMQMPLSAWIAMIIGTILALGIGGGLMALVFFSSRYGYDDRAHSGNDDES